MFLSRGGGYVALIPSWECTSEKVWAKGSRSDRDRCKESRAHVYSKVANLPLSRHDPLAKDKGSTWKFAWAF